MLLPRSNRLSSRPAFTRARFEESRTLGQYQTMKGISSFLSIRLDDDLHITGLREVGKLILGTVGLAAMMRTATAVPAGCRAGRD